MNYKTQTAFTLHVHIACEILKIYNPQREVDIQSIATYGTKRGFITKAQGRLLGGMFKRVVPISDIDHTWWNQKFIDDGMELLMKHKYGMLTVSTPSNIPINTGNQPSPPVATPDTVGDDKLSDYDRAMGVMG